MGVSRTTELYHGFTSRYVEDRPPLLAPEQVRAQALEDQVQRFLEEEGIDDQAADFMWKVSSEVQRAVLSLGSLANTRSPSGALTSRIRAAEKELSQGYGSRPLQHSAEPYQQHRPSQSLPHKSQRNNLHASHGP